MEVNPYLSQVEELKQKLIATVQKTCISWENNLFVWWTNTRIEENTCKKRCSISRICHWSRRTTEKISKTTNEDKHWEKKKKGEGPRMHCGLLWGFCVLSSLHLQLSRCCNLLFYFLRCTNSNCVVIKFKVLGLVFSYYKHEFVWTSLVMTFCGSSNPCMKSMYCAITLMNYVLGIILYQVSIKLHNIVRGSYY